MSAKRIIVVGATGMVGGVALQLCLESPEVTAVTVLGRRSVGQEHPKLQEILHEDFTAYDGLQETLATQDAALFCLGAYAGSVSDEDFRRITVDYAIRFGEALHAANPQAVFCLLSGQGADQSQKSRMAFARYKGAAEKALLEMGFARTHIFRPGYIYPVTPRQEPNLMYKVMRGLYPVVRFLYPNIGLPSTDLAFAMVHAALHGAPDFPPVLENRDIRTLAATHQPGEPSQA